MATRTLHLMTSRNSSMQRAHFAIFVPSAANPDVGTMIHVIGNPMTGYGLQFKRNYSSIMTSELQKIWPIGPVSADNIVDAMDTEQVADDEPRDALERAAVQIPVPGKSEDFLAPVNDTTNRRCQEWTTDYVRYLADEGIIEVAALDIVQDKRDPPNHGIGLRSRR